MANFASGDRITSLFSSGTREQISTFRQNPGQIRPDIFALFLQTKNWKKRRSQYVYKNMKRVYEERNTCSKLLKSMRRSAFFIVLMS